MSLILRCLKYFQCIFRVFSPCFVFCMYFCVYVCVCVSVADPEGGGGGVGGLNPPFRVFFWGLSVYENSHGPGP